MFGIAAQQQPNRGRKLTHRKIASPVLQWEKRSYTDSSRSPLRPRGLNVAHRKGVGKMVLVREASREALRGMHGYARLRGQKGNKHRRLEIIHVAVKD
jgi:hypothetical protein